MYYRLLFHRVGLPPSIQLKPNPLSVEARLPKFYKNFRKQLKKPPSPVHFIPEPGKWRIYNGYKALVENVPIPLIYPKQADEGIWGGEGAIQGFIIRTNRRHRFTYPKFWIPKLKRAIIYSEILNKYMVITVTERTLQLIDKHFGFDNYILETPVQDLKSQLALDLRRKMYLALVNKEVCYDDMSEQERVWEKYEKFKIPKEEAEWFGLSLREAIKKQKLLEEEEAMNPAPLKPYYRKMYFEKLKINADIKEEESEKSWRQTIDTLLGREKKDDKPRT